jgi:hypothetical protein
VLAIAGAGLGGWGLGLGTAARPAPPPPGVSQQEPLLSAVFRTASNQSVGQVFYFQGSPEWLYMAVALPSGDGMVTCQLVDATGKVTTVGSFRLKNGYGYWGSPDPGDRDPGLVREARLIAPNGTTLATASF